MKTTTFFAAAIVASGVVLVATMETGQAQNAGSGEQIDMPKKKGMGKGKGYGAGRGSGAGEGHDETMKHEGPEHKGNPVRHRIIRKGGGVPAPYTNVKNPVAADDAAVAAGKALYTENCATCHGKTGEGDGEAGKGLKPRVANIAFIMDKWIATDPFLFWTISEGGAPLKTAMPAFKDTLSETQRWQIVHYMRKNLK